MSHTSRRFMRSGASLATLVLSACSSLHGSQVNPPSDEAVVVVSGGNAISPFTGPTFACRKGYAAGSTDTALREGLLQRGYRVFTSPAAQGPRRADEDPGYAGFSDCPHVLPAEMTVDANGDIDQAGKNLASFLTYLHDEHGVRKVNIVAHSMGGLFSRAALRVLQDAKSPIQYRSLTTIGTPWEGAFPADYANGSVSMSACKGDTLCQSIFKGFKQTLISQNANAGREVSYRYLAAQGGWNDRQAGVLKGIPVVLIAGDYLKMQGGSSATWPNDGLATPRSAHATAVSDEVLPHRKCILYNNLHSIYFSHIVGIPHEQALTWNPAVLTDVVEAIQNADSALARPNRIGCPPRHS